LGSLVSGQTNGGVNLLIIGTPILSFIYRWRRLIQSSTGTSTDFDPNAFQVHTNSLHKFAVLDEKYRFETDPTGMARLGYCVAKALYAALSIGLLLLVRTAADRAATFAQKLRHTPGMIAHLMKCPKQAKSYPKLG
jgi:hypothetical protein